ncbi:MAG: DUF1292 domain-containing protein [Lachnospiraceae bacterium]|nr:DUF1292 domain-containing protein [Lachnospiraceae bacterium]
MAAGLETIQLEIEGGEVTFYVLEQTTVSGRDYYLVTDAPEGDGDAMILKDLSEKTAEEAVFEFVEDEQELKAIGEVFAGLLEDTELI